MSLVELARKTDPLGRNYVWLTLNRPDQRNALSTDLRDELISHLTDISKSDEIDLVIMKGAGHCFSSGFDLKEALATDLESFDYRFREFFDALYTFPKPLVAAVHGFAFAGGFDTVLAADIIVAEEKAKFGHPEVRFGVMPLLGPLWKRVGIARAFELASLGEILSAEKACHFGIINKVVPLADLLTTAENIAHHLLALPKEGLLRLKSIKNTIHLMDSESAAFHELKAFRTLAHDGDVIEKLQVYVQSLGSTSSAESGEPPL